MTQGGATICKFDNVLHFYFVRVGGPIGHKLGATVDTIRETLTESNTRRKIINIVLALTRAKFLEYYFKGSKSELLTLFKERYKRQKESDAGERFLESFLQDFNDQIIINEDNDLFFN
jgi:hypothetical protein